MREDMKEERIVSALGSVAAAGRRRLLGDDEFASVSVAAPEIAYAKTTTNFALEELPAYAGSTLPGGGAGGSEGSSLW